MLPQSKANFSSCSGHGPERGHDYAPSPVLIGQRPATICAAIKRLEEARCLCASQAIYRAEYPPSAMRQLPVTNEALGDSRKTMASAISPGCPILPRG